jgi:hypothetical protein
MHCAVCSGSLSGLVFMSELLTKSAFSFEDRPSVVLIRCMFELLRNTLYIWDIHRAHRLLLFIQTTATLGIND